MGRGREASGDYGRVASGQDGNDLLRDGQIAQVTRDQSYVQFLVDSGAMSLGQAKSSGFGNVILQAMGLAPEVSVALGKLDLRQRDCLLLCSDGLSNRINPRRYAKWSSRRRDSTSRARD